MEAQVLLGFPRSPFTRFTLPHLLLQHVFIVHLLCPIAVIGGYILSGHSHRVTALCNPLPSAQKKL